MGWTQPGGKGILDLRAVRISDDWDGYQRFRRQCEVACSHGF